MLAMQTEDSRRPNNSFMLN